jgi:hypothetical protein
MKCLIAAVLSPPEEAKALDLASPLIDFSDLALRG